MNTSCNVLKYLYPKNTVEHRCFSLPPGNCWGIELSTAQRATNLGKDPNGNSDTQFLLNICRFYPVVKLKKNPKLAALFTYTIEWFLTRQTIIFQLHFIKAELYQRQQQHLK